MSSSPLRQDELVETAQSRSRYVVLAVVCLVLTAALAVYWSQQKLMDNDEFLSYYGDSTATVADVVRVQLRYPISLDPPAYHVLSHLSMDVFGRTERAMRVPALAGFLLFQWGLFVFVRRMAGSRAGIVALLLPVLSTMYHYAVVGRPYGLLLGMYAMSLVCWQAAARRGERRLLPLVGIAACVGLAITSHYFGVLVLLPVCLAELARTIERRRFDRGVLTALGVGMASVVAILPFRKAVLVYQQHYYITAVSASVIREAYRAIFFRFDWWPGIYKSSLSVGLLVVLTVLAVATLRRFGRRGEAEPTYEWAALAAICVLPVFGYLFGHFVTHTMEVRYVMAWQFCVMACAGLSMQRVLRRDAVFVGVVAAVLLGGLALQWREVVIYRNDRIAKMASLVIPPTVAQAILSDPGRRIYIQSLENFYTDAYYEPDARIRERFSFVYGFDQEIRWFGHDTNVITAKNMDHFTTLHSVPYEEFLAEPKPWVVLYRNGWEWIGDDLKERGRGLVSQGPLMRGELFEVEPAGGVGSLR